MRYAMKLTEPNEKTDHDYKISFDGPSVCSYEMERIVDKTISVRWKPTVEGEYQLNIIHSSLGALDGFPKTVNVKSREKLELESSNPNEIYTCGQGLSSALLNHQNVFQIVSNSFETVNVDVSINGKKPIKFDKQVWFGNSKQATTITYCPEVEGQIKIDLIYKGMHINGSPFTVWASQDHSHLSFIKCSLSENSTIKRNKINEFIVDASFNESCDLQVKISSFDKKTVLQPKIDEIAKNIFAINFLVQKSKKYYAHITDGGFNIPGSPFILRCA